VFFFGAMEYKAYQYREQLKMGIPQMETNLTLLAEKDEAWIEKYRAALATLDKNPPRKGFKKFFAALRRVCDRKLYDIGKIFQWRVRAQQINRVQKQKPTQGAHEPTPAASEVVMQGMKRVEMLRRQSPKKVRSRKLPGPGKPNKNIA
jgi:hypothetical protein